MQHQTGLIETEIGRWLEVEKLSEEMKAGNSVTVRLSCADRHISTIQRLYSIKPSKHSLEQHARTAVLSMLRSRGSMQHHKAPLHCNPMPCKMSWPRQPVHWACQGALDLTTPQKVLFDRPPTCTDLWQGCQCGASQAQSCLSLLCLHESSEAIRECCASTNQLAKLIAHAVPGLVACLWVLAAGKQAL